MKAVTLNRLLPIIVIALLFGAALLCLAFGE
jgi:Na+/H+-dicarboxylate symporter